MNKVIMMGRLTRDPEIRYSQGANPTAVGSFSIAVDRRFKRDGENEADFFSCTAFGKTAEFIGKYFSKGNKIVITGRIQNDNYTGKDGKMVYGNKIMVEEVEFAESKSASEYNNASSNAGGQGDDFMKIPDGLEEELPFV